MGKSFWEAVVEIQLTGKSLWRHGSKFQGPESGISMARAIPGDEAGEVPPTHAFRGGDEIKMRL